MDWMVSHGMTLFEVIAEQSNIHRQIIYSIHIKTDRVFFWILRVKTCRADKILNSDVSRISQVLKKRTYYIKTKQKLVAKSAFDVVLHFMKKN